ncbi:MAG: adaptor protein MecA [Oscillospiraceae bacterium]|jgi:hypothetical protein
MIQDTITDRAVALSFSSEELETLGISEQFTEQEVRTLVQNALLSHGKDPWPDIDAELYQHGEHYFLLAHPARFGLVCFRFSEFEELLAAVSLCPTPLPSSLTYDDGDYLLFVRRGTTSLPAPLYEFAEAFSCSALEAAHLNEQGNPLIVDDAMTVLLEKFSSVPLLFS